MQFIIGFWTGLVFSHATGPRHLLITVFNNLNHYLMLHLHGMNVLIAIVFCVQYYFLAHDHIQEHELIYIYPS